MQLFHELVYDAINVDVIHAERTPAQRDATVDKFRSGKVWVLIATELMARGMDFKGVSLVVNFDFPQSTVSYIHRIGRTGRAGRPGKAVTFFTEADVEQLRAIANVMKASGCEVADWMLRMKPLSKQKRRQRAIKPLSRKPILKKAKALAEGAEHGGTAGAAGKARVGGKAGKRRKDEITTSQGGEPAPVHKKKRARPVAE
jgi:ATP-dependent RNA helicase DDX52/ROK1